MTGLVALLLSADLVVWSGGATQAAADAELAKLRAWPAYERLQLDGYPRVEESAKVAGLKPGFFVVTLGVCVTPGWAKAFVGKVSALETPKGAVPYVRPITDERPDACPRLIDEATLAKDKENKAGCARGEADRCLAMGDAKQACALGSVKACVQRGHDLEHEKPTEAEAGELFLRACTLDATACSAAGSFFWLRDKAKSAGAFERLCTATQNCHDFAHALFKGEGVAQDQPRAVAIWLSVCRGSGPTQVAGEACAFAADAHATGQGVKKDPAEARRLYERGCTTLRDEDCCEALGKKRGGGQGD